MELTLTSVYTSSEPPELASSTRRSRSDVVFTLEVFKLFVLALVLFSEVADYFLDLHRKLRIAG